MTTSTFFMIFIPILSILLLLINLLLAPHYPYQEKDSTFECGFHSFSGQNRTQFSISFFIFGLLFLLFDLEIILIFPFSVSAYTNGIHGLIIMLVFFTLLTLGFIFELGKNALTIDSKQTSLSSYKDTPNVSSFITLELPYPFVDSDRHFIPLELGIVSTVCLSKFYRGFTPSAISVIDILELRNRGVKIYTYNGQIYVISNCNLVIKINQDGSESVACNICRKSAPRDTYKGPLGKGPLSPSLDILALQNSSEPGIGWYGSTSDVEYLIAIYIKRHAGFYYSNESSWIECNQNRILSNPQNMRKFLYSLQWLLDNRPHANITTTQPEGKSGEDSYGNSSLFTSKFLPIINIKKK